MPSPITTLRIAASAVAAIALAGCQGWVAEPNAATDPTRTPLSAQLTEGTEAPAVDIATIMDNMNVALEAEGANYRVAIAEYITDGAGGEAGNTVLSKVVGNKHLGHDFVPGDPRRPWSGANNTITYAIDRTIDAVPPIGGLTGAQTDAAIGRAIATWESLQCSQLGLTRNPDFGIDIGFVAGRNNFVFADVQHAGWRDIDFMGGILGVTFTLAFVSGGAFTDINGDGRLDTAFREIYFDPSFSWADNGVANIDVETVAVHEFGHGLSQAHFGTVAFKNDGRLQASPRAVMNALYAGPFRELVGTDTGGHCGDWADWPIN